MEATRSRNELVRILADVYAASSEEELEPTTYLVQGRLAPFFEPVEIGLGAGLSVGGRSAAAPDPDCFDKRRRQHAEEARWVHLPARRPGCIVGETPRPDHARQDATWNRRPDRAGRDVAGEVGRQVAASRPRGRLQPDV